MNDYNSIQVSSVMPEFSCMLSDRQILAALLEPIDPARAEFILDIAGSLAGLATMGPMEVMALGFSDSEFRRVELQIEFANRVLAKVISRNEGHATGF